jgi:hypothetical protein
MITQEELKKRFIYNPETGIFTYNISIGSRKKGDEANCKNNEYINIKINNYTYKAQRLVWLYIHGRFPKKNYEIDHIDHDGYNNKLSNLREVLHITNCRNAKKMKNNSTGINGVYFHSRDKVWQASIGIKGKWLYIGTYKTKKEACIARMKANKLHGFHTNHGEDVIKLALSTDY